MGSSLNGATVSSVMQRARWTAPSSFCASRIAPMRRSIGLVECSLVRCCGGKVI